MAEKTLIAKVQADENDPDAPRDGVFLNPFDQIITMKILNQRYALRLPRDVHGRITEVFIPNSYTPVAYGEPIARLDPRALAGGAADPAGATGAGGAADEAGQDLITIQAPSEGIFYRRSSPDSPPYVEVGAEITTGSVLGLVEIMKCFNQITYGGPGLPQRGKVAEILADDAAEVQFGQVLFQIKPIA
jgi:acetyl-CoA carboxylase biotin carboxyl carrier protein